MSDPIRAWFVPLGGGTFAIRVAGPARRGDLVTVTRRDGLQKRVYLGKPLGDLWSIGSKVDGWNAVGERPYSAMEECPEVFHNDY